MGRVAVVLLVVLAAAAYVVVQLVRPIPAVAATAAGTSSVVPGQAGAIGWPTHGEAAVGIEGVGVLGAHGGTAATPLGSVAKMMTAYVVLHDHPLSATSVGPNLTVTPTAVTVYRQDQANGDSVVAVQAGEQLSEVQALEGLLIPSGDNIATLLAIWDAGSEAAFVAKMNATAAQMGLPATHYADASGVSPSTKSTAAAQVQLAMTAMQIPEFRTIVGMAQVTLPLAGLQYNVNSQLGTDGIIGVKTGFTTSAGGCFVFAATAKVAGRTQTVVGDVLGQPSTAAHPSALTNAFAAARTLLTTVSGAIAQTTVVRAGTVLGHLRAPWGASVALRATKSVTLMGLPGQPVTTRVVLPGHVHAPIAGGRRLGTAVVRVGAQTVDVPLETSGALPAVSIGWRLTDV